MRAVYAVLAWGIVGLGAVHMLFTFRLHTTASAAIWFFSGGIALVLTGAVNLLNRAYAPVAPGLQRVCVGINVAMTTLMGVAGSIGHARTWLLALVVAWFCATTLLSMGEGMLLILRSALWAVVLPGIVAGYVPWRFFGLGGKRLDWGDAADLGALAVTAAGVALLVACIVEFARRGRGTLSPVDPPRHLVITGLYRHVRNPMYLSVTAMILGEAMLMRSAALAYYWLAWFVCANLFVIVYEEPALRRRFGASYEQYTREVGRWLPTR